MSQWLLVFCFAVVSLFGASPYSIVFVHIGKKLPDYVEPALEQARLFNKECPIFLIGNAEAFRNTSKFMEEKKITLVPLEKLKKSPDHIFFQKKSKLDSHFFNGFWTFTTERFFYLSELIDELNLKNVFHLENDNMLYVNLETLLPTFEKNYPGIGLVMMNDQECVPGFVYISNRDPIKMLCPHIAQLAWEGKDDMYSLASFKTVYPSEVVDALPLIMRNYPQNLPASSSNPEMFSNHIDEFQSIFDGLSLGQYLDGMDPRIHKDKGPGYLNHTSVFDPRPLEFEWELDQEGRKIPYIRYEGERYRVNNLHIHSKRLERFKS